VNVKARPGRPTRLSCRD